MSESLWRPSPLRQLAASCDHDQEHVQDEHEWKPDREQTHDPVVQPLAALKA